MAYNGLFVAKTIEQSLDAPLPELIGLNAFATDFSTEASAAATLTTRYASAGTVQDVPTAGLLGPTGNSTAVTVSMSNYKAVSYTFPDLYLGQTLTPETLSEVFLRPAIVTLANKVIADVISLTASGNFNTNIVVSNPTGFGVSTFVSGNALLDQLYAMRANMKHLHHAIMKQPQEVQAEINLILSQSVKS